MLTRSSPMTKGRSQIVSYPTPAMADVVFYEKHDRSFLEKAKIVKGAQHYDGAAFPDHRCVDIQPLPQSADKDYAIFWAAKRENEDEWNWEHTKADLGGTKYDTITRRYIILREEYTPNAPLLGTAMANQPVDLFDYANFALISRSQDRISERGRRAQESIGGAELDSLFVVETRVYIDREPLKSNKYDLSTNGMLYTQHDIWIRGETYTGAILIETAAADEQYWGPTSGGQLTEVTQVSDDVWIVTTQDLIPQAGLPSSPSALFGGTVIREYETMQSYEWPHVLGDDGTGTSTNGSAVTGLIAPSGIEITVWELKDGATRYYNRPTFKRIGLRVPTPTTIHQEWLTQTQLDAADLDVVEQMIPEPIYYPSPVLPVRIPPTLHGILYLQADLAEGDPEWAANTGSTRYYPATNYTDWPATVIADLKVIPFRGGYLLTRATVSRPAD